jgi:hypothetical protein
MNPTGVETFRNATIEDLYELICQLLMNGVLDISSVLSATLQYLSYIMTYKTIISLI